ncbi:uncharacterized protein LOC141538042 isoform X1 [Cotesia typhae]|uniref:uncharacterized protein LOC141538042 isoform X1 n=1 Tax=Cotesia typhae TaxID=2053667 RepID=UPI003D69DFD1
MSKMNFIFLTILLFCFGDVFEICSGSPRKMTMIRNGGSMSMNTGSEGTSTTNSEGSTSMDSGLGMSISNNDGSMSIESSTEASPPPKKGSCFKHRDKCYSLPGGECQSPEDCLSTSYSCQSGTCQNVDSTSGDRVSSSKPGVSSYWIQDENAERASKGVGALRDHIWLLYVCRVSKINTLTPGKLLDGLSKDCHAEVNDQETDETFYELLIGSNVEWTDSSLYNPAKAVYGGHADDGTPYLICRAKYDDNYVIGKVKSPEYDQCIYGYNWTIYKESRFDVLVEN